MGVVDGAIVIIDLDSFEDYTRAKGLDPYRPNDVTGLLSALVEGLARKWQGVVVYGLDWDRGTEEAVIEFPLVQAEELEYDLRMIAESICRAGVGVSIVAVTGPVTGKPARNRREAYDGYRRRAKRLLERVKSRGGGLYIDGRLAYTCRPPTSTTP